MLLLLTTLDVVVVAAAGSPSSAHTISSSSSCGFSFTQCRPRGQQQPMSPTHRRQKMESSWHHHHYIMMSGPNSPSLLRTKSLRDIMDDSNNINFDELQEQQQQQQLLGQEQKHQRLTRQLSNLSTQEIKRELEHVHGFGVSTLALLRGKASLVEALVDARLQREDEEDVVVNNEGLSDVKNGDNSRNSGSRNRKCIQYFKR